MHGWISDWRHLWHQNLCTNNYYSICITRWLDYQILTSLTHRYWFLHVHVLTIFLYPNAREKPQGDNLVVKISVISLRWVEVTIIWKSHIVTAGILPLVYLVRTYHRSRVLDKMVVITNLLHQIDFLCHHEYPAVTFLHFLMKLSYLHD